MTHFVNICYQCILLFIVSISRPQLFVSSKGSPAYPLSQQHLFRTWSEWTSWSECSRTCGGGVRVRTRVCKMRVTNRIAFPKTCSGETTEYELCERQRCSPFDQDFLEYQCSRHSDHSVAGRIIREWIPYRSGKNPCELQCLPKDLSFVYSFGKVIDGTKCPGSNPSEPALCVNGRCTTIDCAGYLGSDNRRDKCGVCRGDNSSCVKHENIYWRKPRDKSELEEDKDYHYDYNEIAPVPAGSTHLFVKEDSDTNFLALLDQHGNFQINGNWRIQSPGQYFVHGTEFVYNRTWDGHEVLSSIGPTRGDFYIFVLGTGDIPTVRYEYWLTSNRPSQNLRPLSQVKGFDAFDKRQKVHRNQEPSNNFVEEDVYSTTKSLAPVNKLYGYKSFYHRNEILKSVPSWSIKRQHRSKLVINKKRGTNNGMRKNYRLNATRTNNHRNMSNHQSIRNQVVDIAYLTPTTPLSLIKIKRHRNPWYSDNVGLLNVTSPKLRDNQRPSGYLHREKQVRELSRTDTPRITSKSRRENNPVLHDAYNSNKKERRSSKKKKSLNESKDTKKKFILYY